LQFVYTGNVHDAAGGSTYCPRCETLVIERDWYRLGTYRVRDDGRCATCETPLAGVFDGPPSDWGPRRRPVTLGRGAYRS
jgi:pyruvate formate lyase activating enzyme